MSRERQKRRVPTSEELERQGALSPQVGQSATEHQGILKRFFRAGRFRVPEDVAANKHAGVPPEHAPLSEPEATLATPTRAKQANRLSAPEQAAEQSARPRKIRIDESVKERRGLGDGPKT
jgi:hypothetical protein